MILPKEATQDEALDVITKGGAEYEDEKEDGEDDEEASCKVNGWNGGNKDQEGEREEDHAPAKACNAVEGNGDEEQWVGHEDEPPYVLVYPITSHVAVSLVGTADRGAQHTHVVRV